MCPKMKTKKTEKDGMKFVNYLRLFIGNCWLGHFVDVYDLGQIQSLRSYMLLYLVVNKINFK